jgi:hypothetical protein
MTNLPEPYQGQPPQQWIAPAPPPPPPPAGVPVYYFPPQQQPVMWQQPTRPRYVSGLTTGQHVAFGILTACTLGLAAPFWALAAFLGRRRIG